MFSCSFSTRRINVEWQSPGNPTTYPKLISLTTPQFMGNQSEVVVFGFFSPHQKNLIFSILYFNNFASSDQTTVISRHKLHNICQNLLSLDVYREDFFSYLLDLLLCFLRPKFASYIIFLPQVLCRLKADLPAC